MPLATFTTLIDAAALAERLRQSPDRLILLDCRFDLAKPDAGRQAYACGHLPQARYVDLNRDLAAPITADSGRHPLPDPIKLLEFFAGIGITSDIQVIAYDESNAAFAARAWWLLRWVGHRRVAVLDGGYRAWLANSGAVNTSDIGVGGKNMRLAGAAATHLPTVQAAEIVAALRGGRCALVDARASERYSGAVEPIDPVAGHVPGAVNHPFLDNLEPDGRFLPADELRRRWLETLDGKDPREAILMCGSGVTACHNLLAMEIAQLPGARLYAGSWSEWIRDPARPVARGAAA